tara:strand:- start:108 stop:1091 length:984 start_codon:yes stop_codon:yes gene_type:complete
MKKPLPVAVIALGAAAIALLAAALALVSAAAHAQPGPQCTVELIVLGVAQDGGAPQMGNAADRAWTDPSLRRLAVSLGVVDRQSGQRLIFEASPDMREQLYRLDQAMPVEARPGLDGVFLTHAHIGHYTGLMFLGHESMGAHAVPVYAMPRMAEYLTGNGPWSQLVRYENIALQPMTADAAVVLDRVTVTAFEVPHRQEFSEVVGYRIEGPQRSALFIPDIDSWEEWEALGTRIEDMIASVDIAYLDATFYANGEIPARDMSGFPHPFVAHSMERFAALPASERAKVRFIHFNHTNAVRYPDAPERALVEAAGFGLADEGERFCLGR